jgi:hypothetical protein
MAEFSGNDPKRDGQVGLSNAPRAEQDDVAAFAKKAAGG